MANHIELGKKGEDLATMHLRRQGYEILVRNWTFGRKEIDIIASKNGIFIFVEVKTRSTDKFGNPEEAVSQTKQGFLAEAAEAYLHEYGIEAEIRFDIIAIVLNQEKEEVFHIEDAFFPIN